MLQILLEGFPRTLRDVISITEQKRDQDDKRIIIDSFLAKSYGVPFAEFRFDALVQKAIDGQDLQSVAAFVALAQNVYLNQDAFHKAVEAFNEHYSQNENFPGSLNNVKVNYEEMKNIVEDLEDDKRSAFKFIHRYANGKWFLTVQLQTLENFGDNGNSTTITPGKFLFNITENGIENPNTPSNPNAIIEGLLEFAGQGWFDPEYMAKIGYKLGASLDKRVWSFTLPWAELDLLLACNLGSLSQRDFYLNFASVSYDLSTEPTKSLVAFPHSVAVYCSARGQDFLNNDAVVKLAIFRGKAANLDSLSPPNHTSYFWPDDLPAN